MKLLLIFSINWQESVSSSFNYLPPFFTKNMQERFYFGDHVLPLFETGIPLLKQRLHQLPDSDKVCCIKILPFFLVNCSCYVSCNCCDHICLFPWAFISTIAVARLLPIMYFSFNGFIPLSFRLLLHFQMMELGNDSTSCWTIFPWLILKFA